MSRIRQDVIGWSLAGMGLVALWLLVPGLPGIAAPEPLRVVFGWGAFVVVPGLMLGGMAIALADRMGWQVRWRAVFFAEILLLALLALTHVGLRDALGKARSGRGGGLVGWAVAQLLEEALGATGARLVTLICALLALWFLWQTLPSDWQTALVSHLQRLGARLSSLLPRPDGAQPASVQDTRREPRAVHARLVDLARSLQARVSAWFGRASPSPPEEALIEEEPSPPARRPQPRPVATAASAKEQEPRFYRRLRGGRAEWLPSLELLRRDDGNGRPAADVRHRAQLIKQTLADFGVPAEVVSIKEGPTVTQFGVEPGEVVREVRNGEVVRRRVSVQSILRLSNDLALALAAPSIRIEAPVPGQHYVGIEVPNPTKTLVSLRNILESKAFGRIVSPLAIALGRDVSGDPVVADLARMPHLLIAGATGSGKSVCINAIVCSLLMNNGPQTVQLVMVDPKMVELPIYNGIPHLLGPVITDPAQATAALAWLMVQMDDRYRTFASTGVRNILEYNRKFAGTRSAKMPYLVLVIDELADLMMTAAVEIERQVCRLAQMARATGIHLVLATQRPSVDVITGLIKANFPARIAFAVTTQVDSRVILDVPGAEKLLGRGDMLYMAPESTKLARIQGCFVSDQEIERVVAFWRTQSPGSAGPAPQTAPWEGMGGHDGQDELLEQALHMLQGKSHISTSLLQRQLRIGFPRAARLMEQLEDMGVVGPDEGGGRTRRVLLQAGAGAEGDPDEDAR